MPLSTRELCNRVQGKRQSEMTEEGRVLNTHDKHYIVKQATNLFCQWSHNKELIIDKTDRYKGEQLNREARSMAQALSHYGIKKGDTVALIGVASCRFYAAYLAVHKLGAVACNIHVRESATYIPQTLKKIEAKLVISDEVLLNTVSASFIELGCKPALFSLSSQPGTQADISYVEIIEQFKPVKPDVDISAGDHALLRVDWCAQGIVHSNGNFVRWMGLQTPRLVRSRGVHAFWLMLVLHLQLGLFHRYPFFMRVARLF